MDKTFKFTLPSPNFNKNIQDACKSKPPYLTPSGMSLLPREKQPPPMYSKRGATFPAIYLKHAGQALENISSTIQMEKQYCEPCELELNSMEDLKRHRAQHEQCPVVGCLYKGHPSVMDKHVNALHASGLFDKFKKLSTPEEIAAWREERRKKYPTLANVLLKQKAKDQRQKRGERIEGNKKRFGDINDRKRAQLNVNEVKGSIEEKKPRKENKKSAKNKRKNKTKCRNEEFKLKDQTSEKHENAELETSSGLSCEGINMFRGTSQLINYKHFNDNKAAIKNALFSLVGMYGSDDEESIGSDCEGEVEHDTEKMIEPHIQSSLEKNCENKNSAKKGVADSLKINCELNRTLTQINDTLKNTKDPSKLASNRVERNSTSVATELSALEEKSDDDAPEEIPIQRTNPDPPLETRHEPKPASSNETVNKYNNTKQKKAEVSRQNKKFGLDYRKTRLRKQNTLLEKLLESDIRHERNVLLQCVRFVCENNFFNIGQNKNPECPDKSKL